MLLWILSDQSRLYRPLNGSPSCFSLGGGRRGAHPQFSNFREDKENIPHSDDDEDGPILYRDDDNMEDEGEISDSVKISLNCKELNCSVTPNFLAKY